MAKKIKFSKEITLRNAAGRDTGRARVRVNAIPDQPTEIILNIQNNGRSARVSRDQLVQIIETLNAAVRAYDNDQPEGYGVF